MSEPTFRDLGIPFPLNEAPVSTADKYAGEGTCDLCGTVGHRFRFDIGGYVVTPCATCRRDVMSHVADGPAACTCGGRAISPKRLGREVVACHACMRAGRALATHDSELGLVIPELAAQGLTHGVPGPLPAGVVGEPTPDDPEFLRVRTDPAGLLELLRTPGFTTWQGDVWLFHCDAPMIFVGEWKADELLAYARGDEERARGLLEELLDEGHHESLWDELDEVGGLYTFRCARCGRHRASYDLD